MKNIKRLKSRIVLVVLICISMFSVVSAQTANNGVDSTTINLETEFKCNMDLDHEEYYSEKVNIHNVGDTYKDDKSIIQGILCEDCGGYITTRKIGTGSWIYQGASTCSQHANCAIKHYRRAHYYETSCGGTCGYFRAYENFEDDYRHIF